MEGGQEQRFDVYVTAFGPDEDRAVGLLQERLELDEGAARNLYYAVPVHVCSGLSEDVALADFAQTAAEDFEDFSGRAILIEYFAHW